ncbi:MAG: FkbM family methyltransferase [Bacteroidetes bacterium]|nr:FkbM family methyltransferase [Bacteroidota bacterium]
MLKKTKESIRKFVNVFGYEIVKLENHIAHAKKGNWLQKLDIQTIIDIGSNEGQFIEQISRILPNRRIYAFEPIKGCYEKLVTNTRKFDVTAYNYGLSDYNGETEINISENFVSSSLLGMENLHREMYPKSGYTRKETIQIARLDDILKNEKINKNVLIKIDVQGYEEKVIAGATNTIDTATAIIIETSFQPLYNKQWLFNDVYQYFIGHGFTFMGFAEQPMWKVTGIPLYGDAIFIRNEMVKSVF